MNPIAEESASDSSYSSMVAQFADEFSARLAAGENPDIESFVRRAPKSAELIRDVLRSLQLMHELHQNAFEPAQSKTMAEEMVAHGSIGEYEILEEIGRGGMGVVYRARQSTLGRIVALKVLPFAASLDPIKLKRFRVETQSASMIQHPNVVAIYGTGCDRGSHYYAMQYIQGQPLDQWIADRRASCGHASRSGSFSVNELRADATSDSSRTTDLTNDGTEGVTRTKASHLSNAITTVDSNNFRKLVEMAYQAADALHHAHELGVIHRDIKPSNLMIDQAGKIWVTDFGLAHIEAQGTLTATGDLLGTVRYMSPEQAIGGQSRVDRRSDVYSLGATLFEMLTLEPLLLGTDRQSLLRQLTQDEPRSLRRINPKIPIDLETIVLKSVSKQPEQRYTTAAEFAADLKRFMEDQTILARRPSLPQILTRWVRKHKTAAWLMAALPLLMMVGLTLSNIAISYQRNRAENALLVAQRNESKAKAEAKKANAISLVLQQMLGSANPDQSKGNNYTVRQLLDDLSTSLLESLEDQPEVEASLRSTVGNAYRRIGAPDKARPHLARALDLRQKADDPSQTEIAGALEDLAWNEGASGDYPKATQLADQAVKMYREVSVESLHAQWCLQHCLIFINRFDESDEVAKKALADSETLDVPVPVVANILHDLSTSKNRQTRFDESETWARRSVELHQQMHGNSHPETGWGLDALARSLAAQNKYDEAITTFQKAITIFQKNYPKDHSSIKHASELLHSTLVKAGKTREADELERERLANGIRGYLIPQGTQSPSLLRVLVDRKHYVAAGELVMTAPELFQDHAQCLFAIQTLCHYYNHVKRQFGWYRDEVADQKWLAINQRLYDEVIANCPDEPTAKNTVAWLLVSNPDERTQRADVACQLARHAVDRNPEQSAYWNTLGLALYRSNRFLESVEATQRSLAITKNDEYDLLFLSMAKWKLGQETAARDLFVQSMSAYEAKQEKNDEFEQFLDEAKRLIREP